MRLTEKEVIDLGQMEPGVWFSWGPSLARNMAQYVRKGWLKADRKMYKLTAAGEEARRYAIEEWEPTDE